jgi:hypothetical protein
MPDLIVEAHAEQDLDTLFLEDEDTAAIIDVLLDEIYGNEDLIQLLCTDRSRRMEEPAFTNERFIELWNIGYTIYRLKMWDLEDSLLSHRTLHAYDGRSDCTHILAIIHRDHAYDTNHPQVRRCVADYDAIGIYRAH